MHYCLLTDESGNEKIICCDTLEECDYYCRNNANAKQISHTQAHRFFQNQFTNLPERLIKQSKKSGITPEKIVDTYLELGSVKKTVNALGVWWGTVTKCLVTCGIYPNDKFLRANLMMQDGVSKEEICKNLKISPKTYESYMPYQKGSYLTENKTLNALYIISCRERAKEREKLDEENHQ